MLCSAAATSKLFILFSELTTVNSRLLHRRKFLFANLNEQSKGKWRNQGREGSSVDSTFHETKRAS